MTQIADAGAARACADVGAATDACSEADDGVPVHTVQFPARCDTARGIRHRDDHLMNPRRKLVVSALIGAVAILALLLDAMRLPAGARSEKSSFDGAPDYAPRRRLAESVRDDTGESSDAREPRASRREPAYWG
jgi:hypothetical protein